jgi:hypothetical protein
MLHSPQAPQSASTLHCTHPRPALQTSLVAAQFEELGDEHVWFVQVLAGVNTAPLHDAGAQSASTLHCTHPSAALQTWAVAAQFCQVPPGTHVFEAPHVAVRVKTEPTHAVPQSLSTLHCTHPSLGLQTSPVAAQSVMLPGWSQWFMPSHVCDTENVVSQQLSVPQAVPAGA